MIQNKKWQQVIYGDALYYIYILFCPQVCCANVVLTWSVLTASQQGILVCRVWIQLNMIWLFNESIASQTVSTRGTGWPTGHSSMESIRRQLDQSVFSVQRPTSGKSMWDQLLRSRFPCLSLLSNSPKWPRAPTALTCGSICLDVNTIRCTLTVWEHQQ